MRYLQITTTGICVLLGVVASELRELRPTTFEQMETAAKSGNKELQRRLLGQLPVVQVQGVVNVDSVRGLVSVRGPVAVEAENSVAVYSDRKALKVEVTE